MASGQTAPGLLQLPVPKQISKQPGGVIAARADEPNDGGVNASAGSVATGEGSVDEAMAVSG